jgi:ribosomal protein S18 acetylase RimI-like enzyme
MCLALYREDPGTVPVNAQQVHQTLETLRHQPLRGQAVGLDLDGVVAGYALLVSFWSNEMGGELCTVDEIFVQPPHRNRGYGTGLLRELASGSGLWPGHAIALSLEVTPANTRALRLYERLGFKAGNRTMRRMIVKPQVEEI